MSAVILALDVGGTKLAAGILEAPPSSDRPASLADAADGPVAPAAAAAGLRSFLVAPARREEGPEAMIARLVALGREALTAAGVGADAVDLVGVGCGGPLDPIRGVIHSPMNLPGWDAIPLGARLEDAFGRPVAVENDATAATLAEHRFGAGRGCDDVVYLTVSTGIGGGVVSGGRLLRGATGNGAELGHLLADAGLRPCACGRLGCLEGFASGTNIAARAREGLAAGEASLLPELAGGADRITAATVVEGVRLGDVLARRVWDDTLRVLAAGVANAVNAFDPDLVILGGGVTRAGELLFEPLRRLVPGQVLAPMAAHVRIVPAALGDQLGVVAAGAVALERFDHWPPPAGVGVSALREHVAGAAALEPLLPAVEAVGELICAALAAGHRLVAFGNGGSAADAQHLAAELVGHFRRERRGLPALALTTDPSVVTAVANDYAWADVFARQVEALVEPGDVVVGISTSGNAENVVRGIRAARTRGALTVALTGADGGRLAPEAEHVLAMPANATARVQELHTFVVHVLSEQVDAWAAGSEPGALGRGARADAFAPPAPEAEA
ncbi:MAG TPA: ROK family protein [Candidatus Limnocylindrales bacterium]